MRFFDREQYICSLTNKRIVFFDSVESTNTYLKNNGKIMGFPVVCSVLQTSGRGRTGKNFYSEKGAFFSVPYILTGKETKLSFLTLASGLAIFRALKKLYGIETEIKWPNDIYLNGRKLCGILCETVWSDIPFSVVGIGINVGNTHFPEEIENIATSLELNGISGDTDSIIVECIRQLDILLNCRVLEKDNDAILDEIKEHSYTLKKNVICGGIKGIAVDILPDGAVEIMTENGEIKIISMGEVNII